MSDHDHGPLAKTPLFERHRALGGKIVPFAGYEMPVQYAGVIDEHRAVRTAAGLFDVSHMGEFEVRGRDAGAFLDHVTPSRISGLAEWRAQYSALTLENGAFVDDILAYRLGPERFLLVVNASNMQKDWDWLVGQRGGFDVELENRSTSTALIAIQGPKSIDLVARFTEGFDAHAVKYYHLAEGRVLGKPTIAARTGYTGEIGYELFLANDDVGPVWDALLDAGRAEGVVPCGLGARDTLRLEAAMPLYGNDIDDSTNVVEAGLDWIVDWTKDAFIGRAVLVGEKERGPSRVRVGFELKDKGIARHGNVVLKDGAPVGPVTSGTWAPFLEKAIGMAYVPRALSEPGTPLEIDVRGRKLAAEVVALPFYRRPKRRA